MKISPISDFHLNSASGLQHFVINACLCMFCFICKGRRSSGIAALDPEHTEIQGCLFRKKGPYWKLRWCAVSADVFYIFRDSQYSQEVFRCNLRKSYLVSTPQLGATRAHNFKLVVRNGTELSLAAENLIEFERWLAVLKKETSKFYVPLGKSS